MDSDDSRDDATSGSDSESENQKGPHSPVSNHSGASSPSKPESPRGPRSPTPTGPHSPSPNDSIRSMSPKRDNRSSIDETRFKNSIKSPSTHSMSSNGDENDKNSIRSPEDDHPASPKSDSSSSSRSSRKSLSSGRRSPVSPKSPPRKHSPKSPMSPKSPLSPKSQISHGRSISPKSPMSIKSNGPMSPKSPMSVKSNGPMSPKSPAFHESSSSIFRKSCRSKSPVSHKSSSPVSRKSYRSKSPHSRKSSSPVSHKSYRSKSPHSRKSSSPIFHKSYRSKSPHSHKSISPVSRKSYRSKSPHSRKSTLSPKSQNSNSPRHSVTSTSPIERRRPRSPPGEDGHTSDSSVSSRGSSRKSKSRLDSQAEEISDGEMEDKYSDHEKSKPNNQKINLSHEDLSDVSDLDSLGDGSDDEEQNKTTKSPSPTKPPNDLRYKLDEAKNRKISEKVVIPPEKTSKCEDGEEQLDFEAEDGECVEDKREEREEGRIVEIEEKTKEPSEEVEEGEVTDDDEVRPEETEPRPVCRFYSRGQCTWGASCRFLHPGVTDKGNYTMFELIRPMVPGGPGAFPPDYRDERPPYGATALRGDVPVAESAWERGLRTAKEMMRKAIKRKEQDMDFEEKKMNLTLAQEELDKENGYYNRAPSPLPIETMNRHFVNVRHPVEYRPPPRVPEEYYGRRVVYEEPRAVRAAEPEYEVPRERVRYRELPPHRMPDYYNDKYDEPAPVVEKPKRTKREVIVQRVETGRGDEWADPWMRSKSPGGRGKPVRYSGGRRQSYSSASSYSSSSSSRSTSAGSYRGSRSRSRSPSTRRRSGGVSRTGKGSPSRRVPHRNVSPSVIVSEKKAANERAALMNPPAPSPKKAMKDRPPSPGMMRTAAQNPPAPSKTVTDQYGRSRNKRDTDRKKLVVAAAIAATVKRRSRMSRSSSGSESSGSSSSDSETSYSSSSSSRDGSPGPRSKMTEKMDLAAIALKAKAMDVLKNTTEKRQIKMTLKTPLGGKPGLSDLVRKADKLELGKKRPAGSPPSGDSAPKLAALGKAVANSKKSTSRREELLKQLKAVEDAIAKKRSKV